MGVPELDCLIQFTVTRESEGTVTFAIDGPGREARAQGGTTLGLVTSRVVHGVRRPPGQTPPAARVVLPAPAPVAQPIVTVSPAVAQARAAPRGRRPGPATDLGQAHLQF